MFLWLHHCFKIKKTRVIHVKFDLLKLWCSLFSETDKVLLTYVCVFWSLVEIKIHGQTVVI